MYIAENGRFKLTVDRDDFPTSPREEAFGKIICWHKRYRLGDKHDYENTKGLLVGLMTEILPTTMPIAKKLCKGARHAKLVYESDTGKWQRYSRLDCEWYPEGEPWSMSEILNKNYIEELAEDLTTSESLEILQSVPGFVILPVYLYDHSGITVSTSPYSCPWDSGQIGWTYCTPEMLRQEFGELTPENTENAKGLLAAEVEQYDLYLRGEVYGYTLEEDGCEVDSCWGFYGEYPEVLNSIAGDLPENTANLVNILRKSA